MWILLGLILVFGSIIVLQAPGLINKKMWKELAVFFIFLSLAAIYSLGQVFNFPLPNPTKTMEYLFVPAWKIIESLYSG